MAKKRREHILETLLRFEIVVALFTLIGVYYYLSFSPVRLPAAPIRSAVLPLTLRAENPAVFPDLRAEKPPVESSSSTVPANTAPSPTGMNTEPTATGPAPAGPAPAAEDERRTPAPPAGSDSTTSPAAATAAAPPGTATERAAVAPVAPAPAAKSPPDTGSAPLGPSAAPGESNRTAGTRETTAWNPAAPPDSTLPPAEGTSPVATAPTPAPDSVSATGGDTVILAGTYLFTHQLDEARARLRQHGYATRVETSRRQIDMHRMFLGPHPTAAAATAAMRRLVDLVDGPFISRRSDGWYINIGSYYFAHTAQRYLAAYRQRGLDPVIHQEAVELPQYTLFLDRVPRDRTPAEIVTELHRLGLNDALVRTSAP